MGDLDVSQLASLLSQIDASLIPDDPAEGDPLLQTTSLTVEILKAHILAVKIFGGRLGPERQPGLVSQVVGAAFQTFEGEEIHPHPFEKAAVLLRGITQGHPFDDGNKRTGFLAALFVLRRAGYPMPPPQSSPAIYDLCMRLSKGEIRDLDAIVDELLTIWGYTES